MELPEFLVEWPYGEIKLTGHRIGLYSVVMRHKEGMSAEQIAEYYPTLALDHVEKVLEFYRRNFDEVDAYVEAYHQELERQAAESPQITREVLLQRVEARKRAEGR